MKRSFKEIRLHKDKAPQEFLCELLHRERNYVVLRYISSSPAKINGIQIEKGSTTIAHYWKDRHYILWKFKNPADILTGYLFHICNNIEIDEDYVIYEDLELDVWFDIKGNSIVLDQAEVNDCFKRGLLNALEFSLIEQQKKEIIEGFQHILKNVWSEEGIL